MDKDDRYSRQVLLAEIGEEGQAALGKGSALVVGCGGLGSTISERLVRAGVGLVRIADRDVVEPSNLHRQTLFDEQDAAGRAPKAEAAARKLERINSGVKIEAIVAEVNADNIEPLIKDISVVVDGTDNMETRYVVNDACVERGTPWVYGGAVGTEGVMMTIVPGKGPCMRCLAEVPPPRGSMPTCDTVGIVGTLPAFVATLQATEAIKLILGIESGAGRLVHADIWRGAFSAVEIPRRDDCPACGDR